MCFHSLEGSAAAFLSLCLGLLKDIIPSPVVRHPLAKLSEDLELCRFAHRNKELDCNFTLPLMGLLVSGGTTKSASARIGYTEAPL